MARAGLRDLATLPDPLIQHQFDLMIPNVPGGGDGEGLQLRCQSTQLPGVSVETVTVALRGKELVYAGRQLFEKTLSVTFQETVDILVRNTMLNWLYFIVDERENTGNTKADYSTSATIQLYDESNSVIRTIKMFGVFPTEFAAVDLAGDSVGAVLPSATFSYDWFEDE